jgi:hypothetical protein
MKSHHWSPTAAALLVAATLSAGCATLERMAWSSNERAHPIDDNAGATSLPAIFGEKPVFRVESVALAPDIEHALIAATDGAASDAPNERVAEILAQIRDEAAAHLNGLAANSGAIVLVDAERAAEQATLAVRCTIDVLRVVDEDQWPLSDQAYTMRRLIDGSVLADARFECAVTLTAVQHEALIAMQRSEGAYEPDVRRKKEEAEATEPVAAPASGGVLVLSAPTKAALKRALNGAWTELWDAYGDRLERQHRASQAYREPPPPPPEEESQTPR